MTHNSCSSIDRSQQIALLKSQQWDLIIIGGGITGAGILLDAANRGMRAVLLEKKDFAWGTSSRSTKLIHGGLRYLKQLEFNLVREVGMERAIVYRNAMHLVRPEKMLLPLIDGGSLSRISSSLGLMVYDWLAGVPKEERRTMLSKEQTAEKEPLLNTRILKGGGAYFEYRTDDARLTITIIKKAIELGALALNYTEVTDFIKKDGQIVGLLVDDHIGKEKCTISAEVIVNASGPWVDKIRLLDEPNLPKRRLHLTKGVHFVLPKEKLPIQHSLYFDVPSDGRMIFCIPREDIVYIGTTDTHYNASIDEPRATKEDAAYIVAALKNMFPTLKFAINDFISSWAGLRPLIHQEGKSASAISRKDEVFKSASGLISIAGGKLTGYRKMAERVTDEVEDKLNKLKNRGKSDKRTKQLKISDSPFQSEDSLQVYVSELTSEFSTQFPNSTIKKLFFRYGPEVRQLLKGCMQYSKNHKPETALLKAEIDFGIRNEMVHTLSDFFHRRTGMVYFEHAQVQYQKQLALQHFSTIFGWNKAQEDKQLHELDALLDELISFKKSDSRQP